MELNEAACISDTPVGAGLPSVLALAFLGDARHSLHVRKMLVMRGITKSGQLSTEAQRYVSAEAQAKMWGGIKGLMRDCELGVYRRAYNSKHLNKPKRAAGSDYRSATGFEAVVGMLLWLGEEERLNMILDAACAVIDKE